MGKPAGKTLGGSSDHDRRFESSDGPIAGSFCSKCYRPFIPHHSGKCRACRPRVFDREVRKLTPEDEARIEQEINELVAEERAHVPADPADLGAAKEALDAERRKVDAARAKAGRVPCSKNDSGRRKLTEQERAVKKAEARARAELLAEKAEPVMAVCLLKSCSKTFQRKRLLQDCCSADCSRAIEKMRFKVTNKKVIDGYVPGVRPPVLAHPEDPAPPVLPEARGGGEEEGGGDAASVREADRNSGEGEGDAEDATKADAVAEEDVGEKPKRASRFTNEQLKWADEQNRPPHNRGHVDIGRELRTSQAQLSKMLREYRAEHGLDTPDVIAARKAVGQDTRNPKKKASKMKVTIEPKKTAPKTRTVEGKTPPVTGLSRRPARPAPGTKIVGIPLDGVIADAERAKCELDAHKGACPDCQGKVSANDFCMLGRAFSSRWARLEFIAASA